MAAPTIRDVAARAGTSAAVVSYVLNDGPRPVAGPTRERVLLAIAELGYRRNNVARALRANRSGTIGLIVPDLAKPFFAELAGAIEDAAFAHGARLLIGNAHFDVTRQEEQVQALLDARVDAVLLIPSHDPATALAHLNRTGVPHTLVHRTHPATAGITGDDEDAGRQAAQHLAQHGHHHIALLGADGGDDPISRRTSGITGTLERLGLPLPAHRVIACPLPDLRDGAYRATRDLLVEQPAITAVCATTDELAFGALRAATEAGRTVGGDLALVSIDGTEIGAFTPPGLTTVAFPFRAIGAAAVDRVLTSNAGPAEVEKHPMRLHVRRSCGCRGGDGGQAVTGDERVTGAAEISSAPPISSGTA